MSNMKQRACAWLLSAAMIFSGVPASAIAEETEPQKATEAQVSTEKQTEAPTEKKAEEKPAEAVTEKPAEQPAESEKSSEQTSETDGSGQQPEQETEQTSDKETQESEAEASSESDSQKESESESETETAAYEVRFELSEGVIVTVDGKEPENNTAKTKDGTIVFKAEAKKDYKITSVQADKKDLTAEDNGEYKVSGITADGTVITVEAEKEEAPIPDIKVEMQIVDEDDHIIGGSKTRELPDFDEELVLNDPEKAPFEIEYYQFKEAKIDDKTIDRIVKTASEKEEDGSVRYAFAAVSGEEQTALTKDTLITLSYEQVYNRVSYSGSDGSVTVTAVLEKKEAVPDYAVLKVTNVSGGNGYSYDAYMSALSSISDTVPHSSYNTLLYDIAFMVPERDEVGKDTGKMIEYQPEEGSVSVYVTFNGNQISDQLDAEDPAYVKVTHLSLSDRVREQVDSTAAATGISTADISVEPVGASISLDGSTDSAAFSVTDFSVFAFSYTVDFVYEGYKFNLEGADSILLSQLFAQLGIDEDAEKAIIAQFSDESLISIERENDDWRLTSLAPFKTEESLTVTMADGTTYVIGVTDDVTVAAKVRSADKNGDPLAEAGIQILNEEGEEVAKWTSDTEDHVVEGLEIGVKYTLHETEAPKGYLPAKDSTFVLKEDGTLDLTQTTADVQEEALVVTSEPTLVTIRKVDETGELLPGAVLQIVDEKEEAAVPAWTSGKEDYQIEGILEAGAVYTLQETKASDGYIGAEDITFSLDEDGILYIGDEKSESNVITVENIPEAEGSLTLEGTQYVFMTLYGMYGDEYVIKPLNEEDIFTYQIQEITADGTVAQTWTVQSDSAGRIEYPAFTYVKNAQRDDTGTHTYRIFETSDFRDGIHPDDQVFIVEVTVKDDGSKTLQAEAEYEENPKAGYLPPMPQGINFYNEYTASGSISLRANKLLSGSEIEAGYFQFEVISSAGTVITKASNAADGSVTFPAIVFPQGLDGTYTYTMREVVPAGVDKNHPFKGGVYYDTSVHTVTLTARDNGKGTMLISAVYDGKSARDIPSFVNYVVPVKVRKLSSATGNYIYGARMQLKQGSKVLAAWTTEGYDYPLYALDPGVVYTLHEVSAPGSYSVAKDTTFMLGYDGSFVKSQTTAAIASDGVLVVYDSLNSTASASTGTGGKTIGRRGPIINYETGDDTPIALYVGLLAAAAVLVILLLILRRRKRK